MSIPLEYPSLSPIESALRARCPRCGHGKLFNGFLDLQPCCGSCYLDYAAIDAGDGAVVSVALIGAAVIIGLAVWTDATDRPPLWLDMAIFLPPGVRCLLLAPAQGDPDRPAIPATSPSKDARRHDGGARADDFRASTGQAQCVAGREAWFSGALSAVRAGSHPARLPESSGSLRGVRRGIAPSPRR